MSFENFISEALCRPSDYVAYYVGRKLAELHADKAVVTGETDLFDLDAYARAEKCEVVGEPRVHRQVRTNWEGPGKRLSRESKNGWLNVLWRGHLFDVVFVEWTDGGYQSRHHWIIADSKKIAEDFFREVCDWCAEVRGEILVFEDGGWEKSAELYRAIKAASFDNLILPSVLKREIQTDFRQFFDSRAVYDKYNVPWKRGALLIGPPGNGKTHAVKALINELKRPCLYVKSFKARYGTEQESMRCVFQRARQTTPCLIVLEDIDSLVDDKGRSFFLNELDGFALNTGVVVIATTNHPERLDSAILDRPSRFDRKYYFELPAAEERRAYLAAWNENLQIDMRLSAAIAERIVEGTEDFSFAYMKELFLSSIMQWVSTCSASGGGMDAVILERVARLREQMSSPNTGEKVAAADGDADED